VGLISSVYGGGRAATSEGYRRALVPTGVPAALPPGPGQLGDHAGIADDFVLSDPARPAKPNSMRNRATGIDQQSGTRMMR
jgi:hypothetical protein